MPILALTAHALPEEVRKSFDAGCTSHLTKPIRKATLLAAIEEHTMGLVRVIPSLAELVPGFLEGRRLQMARGVLLQCIMGGYPPARFYGSDDGDLALNADSKHIYLFASKPAPTVLSGYLTDLRRSRPASSAPPG